MREQDRHERGEDLGLLLRWGGLLVPLGIGGLLLAARAADDYTVAVGILLAGFSVLLAFRLVARIAP